MTGCPVLSETPLGVSWIIKVEKSQDLPGFHVSGMSTPVEGTVNGFGGGPHRSFVDDKNGREFSVMLTIPLNPFLTLSH